MIATEVSLFAFTRPWLIRGEKALEDRNTQLHIWWTLFFLPIYKYCCIAIDDGLTNLPSFLSFLPQSASSSSPKQIHRKTIFHHLKRRRLGNRWTYRPRLFLLAMQGIETFWLFALFRSRKKDGKFPSILLKNVITEWRFFCTQRRPDVSQQKSFEGE